MKSIIVFIVIFLASVWCAQFPAWAQDNPKTEPTGASTEQTPDQSEEELLKELEKELPGDTSPLPAQETPAAPVASAGSLQLMDMSFDALLDAGASTAGEPEISNLQGGGHDPKKNGFTVANIELVATGVVDPYFKLQVNLINQITPEGETLTELEEAYATTTSLSHGLELKAGQFFTEFGRLNPQHPHAWAFVDQPVINTRMFGGDGMRGPGARLSWLMPTKWYSELFLTMQNANGETMTSFLSSQDPADSFAGYPFQPTPVKTLGGVVYIPRWLSSLDVSQQTTINFGLSGAFGPNATGGENRTSIFGADIYVKHKRAVNEKGFPFWSWQTEYMKRNYEAGAAKDSLSDWGIYSQFLWGYAVYKVLGLRYETADGSGEEPTGVLPRITDPLRDKRTRFSVTHTWYPTEFSKLRLQYNYDKAGHLAKPAHSFWVQGEFLIGKHSAHKF